ncbi:MAG: ABC transporter permease [Chloroflexi bacterium]|nr:ABC transporter permease [Chloroflexota bacterium]
MGAIGLFVVALAVAVAIVGPFVAPYPPNFMSARERLQSPSLQHAFGTDQAGRDMMSRVIVGARTSIYVGFTAVLLSSVVGAMVGVSSAYYGGKYDLLVQRFVDVLQALPGLILALALMAALGKSLNNVIIAITVTTTAGKIRVIRSAALGVMGMQYVDAARAIGAGHWRIMVRHILVNSMAPLIIVATAALGGAILAESSLSFLGLGVPPPHASWGQLVSASREWAERAPWLLIFPGLALTLTVYGFNVLGDALRDIWDPRLRGS